MAPETRHAGNVSSSANLPRPNLYVIPVATANRLR